MLHSATRSHIAIAGTIVAITPLTVAKGASAHDGHYEIDHAEDSEATGEPSDLPSESAATEETPPEQSSDISIDNSAAIQEASAVQTTASTTEAGLFSGFSIGLGEALLALIIAGPIVLISMKRKIHS